MKIPQTLRGLCGAALLFGALVGCDSGTTDTFVATNSGNGGVNPIVQTAPAQVLTLTNDANFNAIREFRRGLDGTLTFNADYSTLGSGSGAGLNGSSNGLFFDSATNRFFAVNAGSNTITVLTLNPDGTLSNRSTVNSGGTRPISITASGNSVYVLNFGDPANNIAANITGFDISSGTLTPIAGSTRALSAANPNPAQIGFSPSGNILVVTERDTNVITTYTLTGNVAGPPNSQASAGTTPFGFDFTPNGVLIVTEAGGGVALASSTSSYTLSNTGVLTAISSAVPNQQSGNCWVATNGAFAYTTNTGSSTVSVYTVDAGGALAFRENIASGDGPLDIDISPDNQFVFTLNGRGDSISRYTVGPNGGLTALTDVTGLPASSVGIVAR